MREPSSQTPTLREEDFYLLVKVLLFKLCIPAKCQIKNVRYNIKKFIEFPKKIKNDCEKIIDLNQNFIKSPSDLSRFDKDLNTYCSKIREQSRGAVGLEREIENLKIGLIKLRRLNEASKIIGMEVDDLLWVLGGKYSTNSSYSIDFVKSVIAYGHSNAISKPLEFKIEKNTYSVSILHIFKVFGIYIEHLSIQSEATSSNWAFHSYQTEIQNPLAFKFENLDNSETINVNKPPNPKSLENSKVQHLSMEDFYSFFNSVNGPRFDAKNEQSLKSGLVEYSEILNHLKTNDESELKKLATGTTCLKGSTALAQLCFFQNISGAKRLLELGANPDAVDNFSIRPLTCAIFKGNLELVKLLVLYKADLSCAFTDISCIQYALITGQLEILGYLIEKMGDKAPPFYEFANMLIHLGKKEITVLDQIDQLGVPKPLPNDIVHAMKIQRQDIFEWYIKQAHWTESDYCLFLYIAAQNDRLDFFELILRSINSKIILQNCLDIFLEFSVKNSKPSFVSTLLKFGANPNIFCHGLALLEVALLLKSIEIFNLLLKHDAAPLKPELIFLCGVDEIIRSYFKKFPISEGDSESTKAWRSLIALRPNSFPNEINPALPVTVNTQSQNHDENINLVHQQNQRAILKRLNIPEEDIGEILPRFGMLPLDEVEKCEEVALLLQKRANLLASLKDAKKRWYGGINKRLPDLETSEHDKKLSCIQLQSKIRRLEQKIRLNASNDSPEAFLKLSIFKQDMPPLAETTYCKSVSYQLLQNQFTLLDCPFTLNSQIICDQLETLIPDYNKIPQDQLDAFLRKIQRAKLVNEGSGIKSLGGNANNPNYWAQLELRSTNTLSIKLPILFEVKIKFCEARILIGVLEPDSPNGKKIMVPCHYLEKGLHTTEDKSKKIFRGGTLKLDSPSKKLQ